MAAERFLYVLLSPGYHYPTLPYFQPATNCQSVIPAVALIDSRIGVSLVTIGLSEESLEAGV